MSEYLCLIEEGREKWGIALLPKTVLLAKLLKYAWSGNEATDTENRKGGDQNVPSYAIKKVEKLGDCLQGRKCSLVLLRKSLGGAGLEEGPFQKREVC